MILSIDPGNEKSAYCLISNESYQPIEFDIVDNYKLRELLINKKYGTLVIENIASYGMAVGKEVFETCIWVGRFTELSKGFVEYIYRREEKINLCNSMKAKDSNIRQALIDRFGVVGTKNNRGWFYGFKSDIWSAYAVGVTYLDKKRSEINGSNFN